VSRRLAGARRFLAEGQRAPSAAKNSKLAGAENICRMNAAAERAAKLDWLRRLLHQSEWSTHPRLHGSCNSRVCNRQGWSP